MLFGESCFHSRLAFLHLGISLTCASHSDRMVAIKVIKNKRQFYKQAMLELEILSKLNQRDHNEDYNIGTFR